MPASFTLQELRTLTAGGTAETFTQRLEEAVDIGPYKTLIVQCRKPVLSGGTGDELVLQHAAVLEESAFVDVASPVFELDATDNEVKVFTDLLRYVRWKATLAANETATFLLDVLARER